MESEETDQGTTSTSSSTFHRPHEMGFCVSPRRVFGRYSHAFTSTRDVLEFSGGVQDGIWDEGDEEDGKEDSTDNDTSSGAVPSQPEMEDVGLPVARTADSVPQPDLKPLFAPREDGLSDLFFHPVSSLNIREMVSW